MRCEAAPAAAWRAWSRPTARPDEERVRQLDEREPPHVPEVYKVRDDAEQRQRERESVDQPQHRLQHHDAVDEPREEPLRDDCVFFDELGEVVEARRCSAWLAVSASRQDARCERGNLPMASVRKQKPTMDPRYPTRGRIHMLATDYLVMVR